MSLCYVHMRAGIVCGCEYCPGRQLLTEQNISKYTYMVVVLCMYIDMLIYRYVKVAG